MPYLKTIICLAVSTKIGGFCVAGKETGGAWVRAVSARASGELNEQECCYSNGAIPLLRDTIEIAFDRPEPRAHQTENHVVASLPWRKTGQVTAHELERLLDDRWSLWTNGEHTTGGRNDCVAAGIAEQFQHSLALIRPGDLHLQVNAKQEVRACFSLRTAPYALKVTDPIARANFRNRAPGDYPMDAYVCVSLTEAFAGDGRCHKLAASLIQTDI